MSNFHFHKFFLLEKKKKNSIKLFIKIKDFISFFFKCQITQIQLHLQSHYLNLREIQV